MGDQHCWPSGFLATRLCYYWCWIAIIVVYLSQINIFFFFLFDTKSDCDRRTNGPADRQTRCDIKDALYIASRGKIDLARMWASNRKWSCYHCCSNTRHCWLETETDACTAPESSQECDNHTHTLIFLSLITFRYVTSAQCIQYSLQQLSRCAFF